MQIAFSVAWSYGGRGRKWKPVLLRGRYKNRTIGTEIAVAYSKVKFCKLNSSIMQSVGGLFLTKDSI
jgi:hypothetical protein